APGIGRLFRSNSLTPTEPFPNKIRPFCSLSLAYLNFARGSGERKRLARFRGGCRGAKTSAELSSLDERKSKRLQSVQTSRFPGIEVDGQTRSGVTAGAFGRLFPK